MFVFLLYFVERWSHDVFWIIAIAEKFDGFVHLTLHVTEADNLSEAFLLVQHTVGTAERLKQSVVFHVLVNIERIKFFAVKACQEHTHDKTEVKRLHVCLLFLHAQVDVIVICTEVLCSEACTIHIIIVIHDGL